MSSKTRKVKCGCGCGKSPLGKHSRFIQGHDAKLHSVVLRIRRGEVKVSSLAKGVRAALPARLRKAA